MTSMTGNRGPAGSNVPSGYRAGSIPQYTKQQRNLHQSLFPFLNEGSYLQRLAGGDESMFEEMERPAHRMFQEQMGQLGSRFSQLQPGAMSAQRGSGFRNSATQATSDFAQDLASKRMELRRQALYDLMGLSGSLLEQRPDEKFLVEKRQKPMPWYEQAAIGFASGVDEGIGSGVGKRIGG